MEELLAVAGYLHDYGKALPEWQEYLMKKLVHGDVQTVPHSIHGAKYIFAKANSFQLIAEILGNIIMSHHGALYDNISPDGETLLKDILAVETDFRVPIEFPIDFNALNNEIINIINANKNSDTPFYISMLIKFAYSCLVDADRLDAFLVEHGEAYSPVPPKWDYFISKLEKKIFELQLKEQSEISILRKRISDNCKTAGLRDIGVYKLEAVTGGGKTFISIRGPVSIQSAFSLNMVDVESLQITKSVNLETNKNNPSKKAGDTIGQKHRVSKGIYVTYGSINKQLAERTGFSAADAEKIKQAILKLFDNDESSARPSGSMEVLKVIWWTHTNNLNSSAKVHRSLKVNNDGTYTLTAIDGLNAEELDGQ